MNKNHVQNISPSLLYATYVHEPFKAQYIPQATNHSQILYKQRLENYLQSRNNSNTKNNKPILSSVKKDMNDSFHLIRKIDQQLDTLITDGSAITEEEWQKHINHLDLELDSLAEMTTKYKKHQLTTMIQNAIIKRQKRRQRINIRKNESKLMREGILKKRKIYNDTIDRWMESEKIKQQESRHRIEKQRQNEQILMAVKYRKSEAEKNIAILNHLQELYNARNRNNVRDSNGFFHEVNELSHEWMDALKNDKIEEENLLKCISSTWQNALFGDSKSGNVMFVDRKKDNLISVRSLWDRFIVSNVGSGVPFGWVLPNKNPTKKWRPWIKQIQLK